MARHEADPRDDGSGDEERRLVEAAQGDPGRFAPLYERHFDRVYAFVVRRVSDRVEAEDLTAEVFQQALAGIGGFEWRGVPFAAWLYRIAANAVADHHRRRSRDARAALVDPPGEIPAYDEDEHRGRLFRLVRSLPPDQRRVVEMRFGEERSLKEIAAALGKSEGAVKQLQFRAIRTLRARMSESHG
jgi:RNA polymerase sigma-70 factor, ECF subfamily